MTSMRLLLAAVVTATMAVGFPAPAGADPGSVRRVSKPVPGEYVVVFHDGAVAEEGEAARGLAASHGARVNRIYRHSLSGFSASMTERAALNMSRDRRVHFVEEDAVVRIAATQSSATWGLDRIDQRDLPLSGTFSYGATGSGVTAYVIDTGIRFDHQEFGGRAVSGYDAIDNDMNASDCHGHGTHVAGTVGGATYGVAKAAKLVAVRVLDCNGNGTISGVVAGVDWVTANHTKPAVANMSLGGGASSSLDDAVRKSISRGVTYSVSAGNSGADACNYSPARTAEALTVGATDSADTKASFSNYGTCLDTFAPGVSITSSTVTSTTSAESWNGTSMAAPHVAGVAALYLETNPGASAAAVHDAVNSNATSEKVALAGSGSPNRLLYSVFPTSGGGETANSAPTASGTISCTDLTCSFTDTSTDGDGWIAAWSWTFGDGASSTQQHPAHTYAAAGTYSVSLTVTDNAGATGTASGSVTVSAPPPPPSSALTLSASPYKVKGLQYVDLNWSGSTVTSVDVYRDGLKIATTANDGFHTDALKRKGGGSYLYKVCEAGTATCSAEVRATF